MADLRFDRSHAWARDEGGGMFTIGVSAFALDRLGELVYVELPDTGKSMVRGEVAATLESAKSISDILIPMSGRVVASNQAVIDEPHLANAAPCTDGWLLRIAASDDEEFLNLMEQSTYEALVDATARADNIAD